jgi:hypothetical protein
MMEGEHMVTGMTDETGDLLGALAMAGGALEQVKAQIEYWGSDEYQAHFTKSTHGGALAMQYATVCAALSHPVLRRVLADRKTVIVEGGIEQ